MPSGNRPTAGGVFCVMPAMAQPHSKGAHYVPYVPIYLVEANEGRACRICRPMVRMTLLRTYLGLGFPCSVHHEKGTYVSSVKYRFRICGRKEKLSR